MPSEAVGLRPTFTWPGCLTPNSKLLYYSRLCSSSSSQLQYNTMIAVDVTTGAVIRNRNKACVAHADTARPAWTKHRFGACGKAPAIAPALPTRVCSQSTDPSDPPTPNPPSPSTPPSSPPTTANPPPGDLPRRKVAAGEEIPAGVARIEAVTAYGAVNTDGTQFGVAVADSGIDCSHPDLNCGDGKSWVQDSDNFPGDSAADKDFYGHGTHVAGKCWAQQLHQVLVAAAAAAGLDGSAGQLIWQGCTHSGGQTVCATLILHQQQLQQQLAVGASFS